MKYLILLKSNPEWAAAFASFTPEQQAEGMALYESVFRELGSRASSSTPSSSPAPRP
ncbi:hypothetical protein [Agromyces protaetiae]|uniref:hypothetical protein n=1 Tax=Agromyces protaetiae TaxID=2509455 RepID=UPI001FB75F71|nr:hypothetical protein [Agromyces protaetiae]